jgi:hypothetical protein
MYEKLSQPFLERFNHFFTGKFDLKNYALTESYKKRSENIENKKEVWYNERNCLDTGLAVY